MARSSKVEMTGRGFLQGATAAMRGDIVRGLIELITNADDAYPDESGEITVGVAASDTNAGAIDVTVFDTAVGLTADEMDACFLKLGAEHSRLARGEVSRGFFGRGAKDVAAFGGVRFASVKSGRYTVLEIDQQGDASWVCEDLPVNDDHLASVRLQPGQSGTAVTIIVRTVGVPKAANLARDLGTHAQLRHLVARRRVILEDRRSGRPKPIVVDPLEAKGDLLFDGPINLSGGFQSVHLHVVRLATRSEGAVNEHSRHGLLVHDGKATHMNTLFGLDREPAAGYIAGVVECPQLLEILRAESERTGGAGLISITRDGLVKEHPYTVALTRAVTEHVKPLIDEIAAEQTRGEDSSEKLREDLEAARRAVQREINRILEEIDGDDGDDHVPVVQIVPERIILKPGSERTLSVRVRDDVDGAPKLAVSDGCVELIDGDLSFEAHDRLPVRVARFRVRAMREGAAIVTASMEAGSGSCAVIAVQRPPVAEPAPERLEFRPSHARVSPTRRRHLRIVAPVSSAIETVGVSRSEGVACELPTVVEFVESADGSFLEGRATAVAGSEKGEISITATSSSEAASCTLAIAEQIGGIDFDFTHRIRHDRGALPRSSRTLEGDCVVIEIWGEDPTVKVLLGAFDAESQTYVNAETPAARAMIAELISLELATHLVELAAVSPIVGPRLKEADLALQKQRDYQSRLVGTFHRALANPERS